MKYQHFDEWVSSFQQLTLPYWNELPIIELYMDQVITIVNGYLEPIIDMSTTKSMINSYVKFKIVDPPVNKKYRTAHIGEIIITSLMKQVFPLELIKIGIKKSIEETNTIEAYNSFVAIVNEEIKTVYSLTHNKEIDITHPSLATIQRSAIRSFLYKTLSIKIIQFNEYEVEKNND